MQFTEQKKEWLLAYEGGYVDDLDDPGGTTNMGITIGTLRAYLGHTVSKTDVRSLSRDTALAIYESNFWKLAGCDRMPEGLDYAVLDYAVHSGVGKAVKDLQRLLTTYGGREDGIFGDRTAEAMRAVNDVEDLITKLCEMRMKFLKSLSGWAKYGVGWSRRVVGEFDGFQLTDMGVLDRSIRLWRGQATAIPAPKAPVPQRAPVPETKLPDVVTKPEVWAPASSAVAAVVAAFANNPILSVALALVVVGGAVLAGVFFYRRMRRLDTA